MSDTAVSLLTPPGTGAIATVAVSGPRAWEFARTLFRPAGKPLPETPELHRFWFGTLGEGAGDEVILSVTERGASAPCEPEPQGADPPRSDALEVHCHGGRRVVRWVVEQFLALGATEREPSRSDSVLDLLQRAPTLRTASILLDQLHGAFDAAVRRVLDSPDLAGLGELLKFARVGQHLVEPWKVVVAGPPNVGKSSLVNALAGYQRAVVSEIAGTTRDAVSVPLAFDGWPVELTDTAGFRDAAGLEAEGIDRARRVLGEADLVLWVMDGSDPNPVWPGADIPPKKVHAVANKADLPNAWHGPHRVDSWVIPRVSANTGAGIAELVAGITRRLVPFPPPPGAAVPYTPALAAAVACAHLALSHADRDEAARLLRDCIPPH